ncbi:MAG: hypothetical protein IT161_16725 [Bryobacterales bacterium]|nr:hypothetical protein [Bryobacterales bacterium]
MKIACKQSGGFGGLTRSAELDTSTLSKSESQKVEKWAHAVLASAGGKSPKARDARTYTFTIDGEQRVFDDTTLTEEGEKLSEYLLKR